MGQSTTNLRQVGQPPAKRTLNREALENIIRNDDSLSAFHPKLGKALGRFAVCKDF